MKPAQIRRKFLEKAEDVLNLIFGVLDDPNKQYTNHQIKTIEWIWPPLSKILTTADDPISIAWDSPDTQNKIDSVLNAVTQGEMSTEQAKKLLALFSMGIDITELPKLIELLETQESSK